MTSLEFYVSGSSKTTLRVDGHYADENSRITNNSKLAHKQQINLSDVEGVVNYYATPHKIAGAVEYHHTRVAVMKDGTELALMQVSKDSNAIPSNIAMLDKLPQMVSLPSTETWKRSMLATALVEGAKAQASAAGGYRR